MKPLAFIIITYNRPDDALELLRNIEQLEDADKLLQEVIIVNNASTSDYAAIESFANGVRRVPMRYIIAPGNLGVAKGRNFAIGYSSAPILIML
ncbi:MAG: glycosyltransferase, partial [Sphingobacteriales bacterium]